MAKQALAMAAGRWAGPGSTPCMGPARKMGSGISRDAYATQIEGISESAEPYVALVPRWDAEGDVDERSRLEASLLTELSQLDLPIRTSPRAVAVEVEGRTVLVCSFLRGLPLEGWVAKNPSVDVCKIVGKAARAVHAIDLSSIATKLPGYETRRAHALAHLRELVGLDEAEIVEARAWAMEHLPPDEPASLLHGDLLGQNVLLDPTDRTAVIDWEYAMRGDPAYDLAIVTRGHRRPLGRGGGFELLLNAYGATDANVRAHEVRVHELCLLAGWYRQSRVTPGPEAPEVLLAKIGRISRRR